MGEVDAQITMLNPLIVETGYAVGYEIGSLRMNPLSEAATVAMYEDADSYRDAVRAVAIAAGPALEEAYQSLSAQ